MSILLPIIIAFFASLLTFFSGFWIGTILLPVFAVFFPLNLAIAMTGVVHLLNNLFKFCLIGKEFNKSIVLKLWIMWVVWAFMWAYLLLQLSHLTFDMSFILFWHSFETNVLKWVIWLLLIVFSIIEVSPKFKRINFWNIGIYIIWFLSWLFWWLSWHQWALRTSVLVKMNLEKNVFIATGVVIALMVDFTRITIYFSDITLLESSTLWVVFFTTLSAFLWAYVWKKMLKKVTIDFVKNLVSLMLIIMWLLMILGVI